MRHHLLLRSILIVAVAAGVFFRFFHLDTKAYWFDETFTSLRISGYTDRELLHSVESSGGMMTPSELRKFQTPQPHRTVVDTVRGLAVEEPQNPPLYFAAARLWAGLVGGSIVATRLLPALLSLLVLPAVYWLCLELFASVSVGLTSVAIASLSPLHVLFAQTARPQSLWTAIILLSSAALLWAIRTGRVLAWAVYTLSIIIALYTFILSGLFVVGFGFYVLIMARFRVARATIAFAVSSVVAALAFVPWALALYEARSNVTATTNWTNSKLSFFELIRSWIMGVVRLFFDVNNQSGDSVLRLLPIFLLLPLLLILIAYSLYSLCGATPRRTWLFVLLLIGSSFLPLAVPDLINGGTRMSAAQRYLIPAYLGLQLAVAFTLAQAVFSDQAGVQQSIWRGAGLLILLLGGLSCWVSSYSEAWWNKDPDGINPEIARRISQSASPLVLSDGWMGHALSLSWLLRDDVKLKIEPLCYVCSGFDLSRNRPIIPDGVEDVFYFHPGWEPPSYLPAFTKSVEYGSIHPLLLQRGRTVLWRIDRP